MGFDPLNEPNIAYDGFADSVNMWIPGNADKKLLKPLYERLQAEYRKASNTSNRIMYYEPFIWPEEAYVNVKFLGL